MKRYSIGLIGYGGFGRFLRSAWSKLANAEVVALADTNPTRSPGDIKFYADWRSLIEDEHIDVVAVATPPDTHASIACAALDRGKHVLLEKPVATTLEAANEILVCRSRGSRVVSVDYMLRYNPIVETLHAWCRSGCFGRLRRVAVENYAQDESLPPEHWFWNRSISGGILVEHAVHFFDIVQWCCGSRPVRVDGLAIERPTGQEDRVMATVVHEDGLVASHYHAFSGPDSFERTSMRFVFDLLRIDIDGWIPMSGRLDALVTDANRHDLERLTGFRAVPHDVRSQATSAKAGTSVAAQLPRTVSVTGVPFQVVDTVQGEFALPQTKLEAYADALRALMEDFLVTIGDPGHQPRVTLEDGVASLETALRATASAHSRAGTSL